MDTYVGLKVIKAEPQECPRNVYTSWVGDPGYKVQYEDGYVSWSPAEPFEKAYRKSGNMSFGMALEALKQGRKVSRKGWNGKGMWLSLQVPDENSKMTLPYIYIEYPSGHSAYPAGSRVPWLASQTDMLTEDWGIC